MKAIWAPNAVFSDCGCSSILSPYWEVTAFTCFGFSIKVRPTHQPISSYFLRRNGGALFTYLTQSLRIRGINNSLCQWHLMQCQCMCLQCISNVASFICIYDMRGWHRLSWRRPRRPKQYCTPQGSWRGSNASKEWACVTIWSKSLSWVNSIIYMELSLCCCLLCINDIIPNP